MCLKKWQMMQKNCYLNLDVSSRLAYSSLDKHKEAVDCFTKALTIEPSNDSYQTNLNLAKEKLQSTGSPGQSNVLKI
jgi:tetratricopeptide (TPR) repeat protein